MVGVAAVPPTDRHREHPDRPMLPVHIMLFGLAGHGWLGFGMHARCDAAVNSRPGKMHFGRGMSLYSGCPVAWKQPRTQEDLADTQKEGILSECLFFSLDIAVGCEQDVTKS